MSTETEAALAGPLTAEPVETAGGRRFAVVRRGEPTADGGGAAGLFRERGEALRAAAVFPAVAAPPPYHLKDRPKRLGYPLHCHHRHVGHLCHAGATLARERRAALLSHLHLARYLATHPHALALLLESVGPEALPVLGRVLARRVEEALPQRSRVGEPPSSPARRGGREAWSCREHPLPGHSTSSLRLRSGQRRATRRSSWRCPHFPQRLLPDPRSRLRPRGVKDPERPGSLHPEDDRRGRLPDHDQHFKKLIETCFADLVRIVAPRIATRLHLDRPTFLDKEQFTDVREGEHRRLDLVAQVRSVRGEPEVVIVHVEVEAQARQSMGRRLLEYAMQLWLRHGAPIVPIVVYLRGGKPGVPRERVPLRAFGTIFFTFRYFAFGLSRSQAREYLARPEPLAWALAALMRRGDRSAVEHRLACLQPIARAEIDDARKVLLASCVETYVQLNESEREDYEILLDRQENREVATMERTLLTTLDRAAQKGFQQGREEGIEQGIEQGRREVLLDLLGRRFGPLPDAVLRRLEQLRSPDEIGRLAERILDARSLDDLGL